MTMARNYFSGKNMSGTFSKGEGPVSGLDASNERENPGLLTGGEGGGKNLREIDGATTFTPATGDDGLFSLRGKNYVGPQNFQPENIGVTNPFDINKG
jgi:hypothetical protein